MSGLLDGYPPLLTVEDVQEVLQIGRTLAYQAMREGELPTVRIGRTVRVPRPALERYIERHTEASSQNEDAPAGTGAPSESDSHEGLRDAQHRQ